MNSSSSPSRSSAPTRPRSRREFLQLGGGCAALSSTSFLSTLLNLKLTSAALAQTNPFTDYKALVCVFLPGGLDSFNLLTPYDTTEYSGYASARSGLALPKDGATPLQQISSIGSARTFGLHPAMPKLRQTYTEGKACFVANVGSMIEPTTKANYATAKLPLGLFSHSDLQRHWMTAVPQSRTQITGWGGRMSDILTDAANMNPAISMSISVSGGNVFQAGASTIPYTISTSGASILSGYNSTPSAAVQPYDRVYSAFHKDLVNQTYTDLLEKTLIRSSASARDAAASFQSAFNGVTLPTVTNPFGTTGLSGSLSAVAKVIAARNALSQKRQIFFVSEGSWDHHANLLTNQQSQLPNIDNGLRSFQETVDAIGLSNQVTLFTISDFGRTLSSNGIGSDHAWGGNAIVMGGAVQGGRVHGQYPTSLAPNNELDLGRGTLIPTTSCDQYQAELAMWFGMANDSYLEAVLPNIRNFYPTGATQRPMGFMN